LKLEDILSANVTINGGVKIRQSCSIGVDAIKRDFSIGDKVIIGGNSCVVKI